MKATLEFNLDDVDDKMAHMRCVKSTELCLVIWDFLYSSRRELEHEASESMLESIDLVYKSFMEQLYEKRIDLDELIS